MAAKHEFSIALTIFMQINLNLIMKRTFYKKNNIPRRNITAELAATKAH
jgi:hypothetical protein